MSVSISRRVSGSRGMSGRVSGSRGRNMVEISRKESGAKRATDRSLYRLGCGSTAGVAR